MTVKKIVYRMICRVEGVCVVLLPLRTILLFETAIDDVEDLLHDDLGLFALAFFCGDGLVDGQRDGASANGFGIAAEHIEGTIDGEWHDGDADFVGEHERTTLERPHFARTGASAFREDNHRHAALQGFPCLLHRLSDARDAIGQVDVLGLDTGITDKGNLLQIFLHHPLEIVSKVAVSQEDVIVALVVRQKDVAFVFLDVLSTFHLHFQQEKPEGAFRPELGQVISHHVGVAQKACDDDTGGHEDGDGHEDGKGDSEGVNFVENF